MVKVGTYSSIGEIPGDSRFIFESLMTNAARGRGEEREIHPATHPKDSELNISIRLFALIRKTAPGIKAPAEIR